MAHAETTDVILALYIGESFAEAHLSYNQKQLHFHRWYLGKDSLKIGLQKFLQEAKVEKISSAFVASRFLEKIFAYRLGGSVATLTTKGFEHWPATRQPQNAKVGPLSSADLVFGVDERTGAQGQIEKEVSDTELQELAEKLKQKQAKRVCIHFLNAYKNPANQNKAKEFLLKENFEIFVPCSNNEAHDEVSYWRRNLLNASLSGTFEEIQEEINEALKAYLPENQRVRFHSSENALFDQENNLRLSSLWGAASAWSQQLKKRSSEKFDLLYLGLEQFALYQPEKINCEWKSPWGLVHAPQVQRHLLSLQPTSTITVSTWGEMDFSKDSVGYEPGPMSMGRGQIPTFLDLWAEQTAGIKGVEERRSAPGLQKFKNQIWALNKATSQPLASEEKVITFLQQFALQKIATDISLRAENKKIICLGAFVPLFMAELKKRLPHHQFEVLPESETSFLLSQDL